MPRHVTDPGDAPESGEDRAALPSTPAAATSRGHDVGRGSWRSMLRRLLEPLYVSDMEAFATAASHNAGEARRAVVSVDDLVVVCLRERAAQRALERFELDALDVADEVEAALNALPADADRVGSIAGPPASTAWQRVWRRTNAARVGWATSTAVDDVQLLVACLLEEVCVARAVLARAGVSPRLLLLAGAGYDDDLAIERDPALVKRAGDDEDVAVVVLDSSIIHASAVCATLQHALAVPHDRSHALMLEVHQRGAAAVLRAPSAEARAARDRITAHATERLAPLRVRLLLPEAVGARP